MSTTPFSLTAPQWYWRLSGCGRSRAASSPPGFERDPAHEAEDQERDDGMEDSDPRVALAAPREHDLDDEQEHQDDAHADAALPEPCAERQEQQHERSQEDQVAEAVVEVEAVRELVLAERPGIGLVGRVERAVAGRADLHQHGDREQQSPVAVNRPQRLHAASLNQ